MALGFALATHLFTDFAMQQNIGLYLFTGLLLIVGYLMS